MNTQHEHGDQREVLRETLQRIGLKPGLERPCSYLPDQLTRNVAFSARALSPGVYHSLMDLNFRRCGTMVYRPACRACDKCRALRILVNEFRPNRTQRRCRRHNADLRIDIDEPRPTEEKHELYRHYLADRHDREMDDSWDAFEDFLYRSPVETVEMTYRLGERLVAVGLIDVEPQALSTVYCYFDPDLPGRSLGTFNVLFTIEYCRQKGVSLLYLGYYIRNCRKMSYKIDFRPCEILGNDEIWRRAGRDITIYGL